MPFSVRSRLPQLDARLAAAAAFVRKGSACADIGCDHGKLSVHLAANGLCKRVIACDIRPAPLQQARRNLALHCREGAAECRLGDGLCAVAPSEVQDIVIAGVSGVTAVQILQASPAFWTKEHRFVFVPTTKNEVLRQWLCETGFCILAETAVEVAGRFYGIMHVAYTGEVSAPTPLFCLTGLIGKGDSAAAVGYLEKLEMRLRREGKDALAQAVNEVKEQCKPQIK